MLYPLKFDPILKEKIWGGSKLQTFLNKPVVSDKVGESWEVSSVENNISVISNGVHKGKNLIELITEYKEDLVGNEGYTKFENQFPLLVKFIDAKEDLSIQLHPNDELSKKRHNSFGKTEMWYVLEAEKNSELIIGFNKKTSQEEYIRYLERNRITELLNFEKIHTGDAYFIDGGTIHAIGAGTLIAEIQQTSDITYRIYDWDRKDAFGKGRKLHTDLALDALDYDYKNDFKLIYKKQKNEPNSIVRCKYFNVNYLKIVNDLERVFESLDSFKIFMCVKGQGTIRVNDYEEKIAKGETILIPAIFESVFIESNEMELLEVYI